MESAGIGPSPLVLPALAKSPEDEPKRINARANTYPEILRRHQGVELGHVPDRTCAVVGGDHFDLTDITERVDTAFDRLAPTGDEEPVD